MTEPSLQTAVPPSQDIPQVAEHLFRHEWAKLVAILTRIFGIARIDLAEDVVQEALLKALHTWPFYGVPKNPAAWLTQTAKNLALDTIRREKTFRTKEPDIIASFEGSSADPGAGESLRFDNEIKDDQLRMMFACCHPIIPQESQVALALRTLCGFSSAEISKAFLTNEPAIEKRLVRARQKIREDRIAFEIPAGQELSRRLDAVLQTLYLLFNEGYKASSGEKLIREELCREAIRLTAHLVEHPAGNQPRTHALLALMLLNAARLSARTDTEGNILRLKEQDRSAWDQPMIARGMFHLAQSATGDAITEYHLQAGIAACHCAASDYQSTDWLRILALYDQLVHLDASPVVALNRAVAVANVHGPKAGLRAVQAIQHGGQLDSYYLFHAVLGEFQAQLKNFEAATNHVQKALQLTDLKSERAFLTKRLAEVQDVESIAPSLP